VDVIEGGYGARFFVRRVISAGSGFLTVCRFCGRESLSPLAVVMRVRVFGNGTGFDVRRVESASPCFHAFHRASSGVCYCPFAPVVNVSGRAVVTGVKKNNCRAYAENGGNGYNIRE
jgi:hypothetical protein